MATYDGVYYSKDFLYKNYTVKYGEKYYDHDTRLDANMVRPFALLSLLGSLYILYDILRNTYYTDGDISYNAWQALCFWKRKRNHPNEMNPTTSHHHHHHNNKGLHKMANKIMVALSTCDCISSLMFSLSTVPVPKGQAWGSLGNIATCNIQGFLTWYCMPTGRLYNASLAICYVFMVRYGWTEEQLIRIQKYFLFIPHIFGLLVAVPLMVDLGFNFDGLSMCGPSTFPSGCKTSKTYETTSPFAKRPPCMRGGTLTTGGTKLGSLEASIMIPLDMCLAGFIIVICMVILYWTVRSRERQNERYDFVRTVMRRITTTVGWNHNNSGDPQSPNNPTTTSQPEQDLLQNQPSHNTGNNRLMESFSRFRMIGGMGSRNSSAAAAGETSHRGSMTSHRHSSSTDLTGPSLHQQDNDGGVVTTGDGITTTGVLNDTITVGTTTGNADGMRDDSNHERRGGAGNSIVESVGTRLRISGLSSRYSATTSHRPSTSTEMRRTSAGSRFSQTTRDRIRNLRNRNSSALRRPRQSSMVAMQGFFYSLAYWFSVGPFLWNTTYWWLGDMDIPKKPYWWGTLVVVTLPLQGFFNALVYLRPRLVHGCRERKRQANLRRRQLELQARRAERRAQRRQSRMSGILGGAGVGGGNIAGGTNMVVGINDIVEEIQDYQSDDLDDIDEDDDLDDIIQSIDLLDEITDQTQRNSSIVPFEHEEDEAISTFLDLGGSTLSTSGRFNKHSGEKSSNSFRNDHKTKSSLSFQDDEEFDDDNDMNYTHYDVDDNETKQEVKAHDDDDDDHHDGKDGDERDNDTNNKDEDENLDQNYNTNSEDGKDDNSIGKGEDENKDYANGEDDSGDDNNKKEKEKDTTSSSSSSKDHHDENNNGSTY